jgi:hypothetical protein
MVSRKLKAPRRPRSTTVAPNGPITGVRRSRSFVATWYSLANSMTRSSTRSSFNAPTRTGGPRQSHLLPFTRVRRAAESLFEACIVSRLHHRCIYMHDDWNRRWKSRRRDRSHSLSPSLQRDRPTAENRKQTPLQQSTIPFVLRNMRNANCVM